MQDQPAINFHTQAHILFNKGCCRGKAETGIGHLPPGERPIDHAVMPSHTLSATGKMLHLRKIHIDRVESSRACLLQRPFPFHAAFVDADETKIFAVSRLRRSERYNSPLNICANLRIKTVDPALPARTRVCFVTNVGRQHFPAAMGHHIFM